MKYEKPEMQELAGAVESILGHNKQSGNVDSLVTQPTIAAYEADE
jgi:hypothetical protein